MLPGTCTRPEIRVKLFCEDPQAVCDAQRRREDPNDVSLSCLSAETGAHTNPTQATSEYLWLVMASYGTSFCFGKGEKRYCHCVSEPPGPTCTLESMDVASKSRGRRGRGVRRCHAAFVDGDGIIETWKSWWEQVATLPT